jgi:hypothetical protein
VGEKKTCLNWKYVRTETKTTHGYEEILGFGLQHNQGEDHQCLLKTLFLHPAMFFERLVIEEGF